MQLEHCMYARLEEQHLTPRVGVQAEATALKVPVRFLHELRALLPQAAQNDDAHSGNGAQLDAGLDSVKTAEVTLEEESCLVTSELQTALMAAPQMIAANSGALCHTERSSG